MSNMAIRISKVRRTRRGGMVASYVTIVDGITRRAASFLPKAVKTMRAARKWLMSTIKIESKEEEAVTLSPVEALAIDVHRRQKVATIHGGDAHRLATDLTSAGIRALQHGYSRLYHFIACGLEVRATLTHSTMLVSVSVVDQEQVRLAMNAPVVRELPRVTERDEDLAHQWSKSNRWYHAIVATSDLTSAERERFRSHVKAAHSVASMKDMTPAQMREVCARLRAIPRSTMGDVLREQMRGAI